jgi:membrane protease YdiL (CAAX protease family)
MLVAVGGLYLVLGAFTLHGIARRGELGDRFRLVRGDLWMAAVTAGILYGGARVADMLLTPRGTPHELWLMRVYLQLGTMPGRHLLPFAILVIAALEELVWRGLVMVGLEEVMDAKRAAAITTALYVLAHAPTLVLLRMPGPGLNPMILLAALGTSVAFATLAVRSGRLTPPILAHALFTWSVVEFPLWQIG